MTNQPADKRAPTPPNPLDYFKPSAIPPTPAQLLKHARDFPFARAPRPKVALPRSFQLPKTDPEANQGPRGTCMIWSLYRVMRSEHRRLFGVVPDWSEEYGYADYNESEGTLCQDQGAYPHPAAERLVKVGVIPEASRPYLSTQLCQGTSMEERMLAQQMRATMYIRAYSDEDIKRIIYGDGPPHYGREVTACFVLATNFDPELFNGQYFVPTPAGEIWGGHAMTYDGWDDDLPCPDGSVGAWDDVNQWGFGWGNGGSVWMPYSVHRLPDWQGNGFGAWRDSFLSVHGINGVQEPIFTPTAECTDEVQAARNADEGIVLRVRDQYRTQTARNALTKAAQQIHNQG
jgi:C1A family cysteine protease